MLPKYFYYNKIIKFIKNLMLNTKPTLGMQNLEKKCIDLYIPRKCVYTNRILDSKDRSSVQLSIAEVNLKLKSKFRSTWTENTLEKRKLTAYPAS